MATRRERRASPRREARKPSMTPNFGQFPGRRTLGLAGLRAGGGRGPRGLDRLGPRSPSAGLRAGRGRDPARRLAVGAGVLEELQRDRRLDRPDPPGRGPRRPRARPRGRRPPGPRTRLGSRPGRRGGLADPARPAPRPRPPDRGAPARPARPGDRRSRRPPGGFGLDDPRRARRAARRRGPEPARPLDRCRPADLDARVARLVRIAASPHPGDPDRADRIARLSAILDRDPGHVPAREALLVALADAGEPDRGRAVLDAWPEPARDARYDRLRGRWDLDYDHRADRAAEAYARAVAELPHDWKSHYGLARRSAPSAATAKPEPRPRPSPGSANGSTRRASARAWPPTWRSSTTPDPPRFGRLTESVGLAGWPKPGGARPRHASARAIADRSMTTPPCVVAPNLATTADVPPSRAATE